MASSVCVAWRSSPSPEPDSERGAAPPDRAVPERELEETPELFKEAERRGLPSPAQRRRREDEEEEAPERPRRYLARKEKVTESARACSYILSTKVQETCQF